MQAKALPDAFQVYQRCNKLFSGQAAQIRKLSKVTQLLIENKESLTGLTIEFTIPAIATVAAQLLKDKIFESQDRASQRFPGLPSRFPGLPSPSDAKAVERAPPQTESSKSEAKAVQDAAPNCGNRDDKGKTNDKGQDEIIANSDVGKSTDPEDRENSHDSAADSVPRQYTIPELEPVYLPFKTQHILLTTVQRMLEHCCFDYGHDWMPDLMKNKGWGGVESLELTQWTPWFLKESTKSLPRATMKQIEGKSVAEILSAVGGIRHAAVHRVRTSAEEISDMLGAAQTFADMLNDESKVTQLRQIKIKLSRRLEETGRTQTMLRRKLTEQLDEVARQRAELDKLETSCIENFRATDEKHRNEAGAAMEAYLDDPQKSSESLNESEKGESSDESEKEEHLDEPKSVNAPNAENEDRDTMSLSHALQ